MHRAYKTRRNLTLNVTEHWFPLAGCTCILCGLLWKLLDVDLVSSLPNFKLWKNNTNRNDWFCAAQRHANKKCIPNVFKMLSARTHECVRITCARSADTFCHYVHRTQKTKYKPYIDVNNRKTVQVQISDLCWLLQYSGFCFCCFLSAEKQTW